ncbi:hypothetical protein H7X87_01845 [Acetobacteraceae bacterium]|nr:hypothetical protein [Candidatus Parcubacteria bacterium]
MNKYLQHDGLEKWSFIWSEVRLLVAAVALFLGGVPPLLYLFPTGDTIEPVVLALKIAWIISGLASAYLLYQWVGKRRLFGKKDTWDTTAFFVSVVSGFNLGITGIFGQNIGMSLVNNSTVFIVVGLIYVVTAVYLFRRWQASGNKLFS